MLKKQDTRLTISNNFWAQSSEDIVVIHSDGRKSESLWIKHSLIFTLLPLLLLILESNKVQSLLLLLKRRTKTSRNSLQRCFTKSEINHVDYHARLMSLQADKFSLPKNQRAHLLLRLLLILHFQPQERVSRLEKHSIIELKRMEGIACIRISAFLLFKSDLFLGIQKALILRFINAQVALDLKAL